MRRRGGPHRLRLSRRFPLFKEALAFDVCREWLGGVSVADCVFALAELEEALGHDLVAEVTAAAHARPQRLQLKDAFPARGSSTGCPDRNSPSAGLPCGAIRRGAIVVITRGIPV